jgi:hypothetical protein
MRGQRSHSCDPEPRYPLRIGFGFLKTAVAGIMLLAACTPTHQPRYGDIAATAPPVAADRARLFFYRDYEPYESLARPYISLARPPPFPSRAEFYIETFRRAPISSPSTAMASILSSQRQSRPRQARPTTSKSSRSAAGLPAAAQMTTTSAIPSSSCSSSPNRHAARSPPSHFSDVLRRGNSGQEDVTPPEIFRRDQSRPEQFAIRPGECA